MNYFKGLISCNICNRKFNYKLDHGQHQYLCSSLKNYGSDSCVRRVIREDDIIWIFKNHCDLYNKNSSLDKENIDNLISKIEIDKNGGVKIHWKDNKISEWDSTKLIF